MAPQAQRIRAHCELGVPGGPARSGSPAHRQPLDLHPFHSYINAPSPRCSPIDRRSSPCAGHTAAIYTARAELKPVMFEGFMACDVAPGGQLTMTTLVENYPGFPKGVMGLDLMTACRERAVRCGTTIFTETVERVDLTTVPFRVWTSTKVRVALQVQMVGNRPGAASCVGADTATPPRLQEVTADALVVATGAYARRLHFPGADRLWNLGVSACAVCDGPSPCFRDCPLAVIGGGDTAMEYATYLAKAGRTAKRSAAPAPGGLPARLTPATSSRPRSMGARSTCLRGRGSCWPRSPCKSRPLGTLRSPSTGALRSWRRTAQTPSKR